MAKKSLGERMDVVGKLGVNLTMEFAGDHVFFTFFDKGKKVGDKKVNLVKKVNKDLKRLGRAFGTNLLHCFYLGRKYCKNFSEQVCAYRIISGKLSPKLSWGLSAKAYIVHPMSVIFYRKKRVKSR